MFELLVPPEKTQIDQLKEDQAATVWNFGPNSFRSWMGGMADAAGYRFPPGSLSRIQRQGHQYIVQRRSVFTIVGS